MKVTDASLRKWLVGERKKNDTLRCSELGGFHIRGNQNSENGAVAPASYRISYKINGVQRRTVTIAKYGEVTLAKARNLAGGYKAEGKAGIDRIAARKKEKQKRKDDLVAKAQKLPTFQEWFDERHKDRLIERGDSGKQRTNYLKKRWWPYLGCLTIDQLTVEVVAENLKYFGYVKESTAKKYVDYLKEAVAQYCEDNNTINPLKGST